MEVIIAIFAGVLTYHLGFDYFHLTDGVADAMGWLVGFLVLAGGERFVKQIYRHWNAHIDNKIANTRALRQSMKPDNQLKTQRAKTQEKEINAESEEQEKDYNFFK